MKVIEFIKEFAKYSPDGINGGLQALTDQFAISVKKVDDLLVLNYNQIDSPKTDPIVMECRSLILEAETLDVVSRSFCRFFNLGEALNVMPEIDWNRAVAYEKVDGSLIKLYRHKGRWNLSTKGTAYAESDCMGYGVTFQELVWKALGVKCDQEFQSLMDRSYMHHHITYIFELTSVENRVVKRYDGYKLHFLAARNNETGDYETELELEWLTDDGCALSSKIHHTKKYRFDTPEECLRTARELKDLEEGYVIYENGVPIAKIKSPAYVAVHHLRDSLNMGRDNALIPVVVTGECDEVISYFPEYESRIREIEVVWNQIIKQASSVYSEVSDIENQKEFAQTVNAKSPKLSSVLFSARKLDKSTTDIIMSLETNRKVRLVEGYL